MGIKLFIIFISILLMDGVILPAFFGFEESFLSFLFLIMPLLYLGATKQNIVFGFIFAVILEAFRGVDFGVLAIPFLITAALICVAQIFLETKLAYDARFNLGKSVFLTVALVAFVYVFIILCNYNRFNVDYFSFIFGLISVLESFILILIFNAMFNKRAEYVG